MPQKLDFITPATMRVLDFFFADPLGEYHEREVMRLAYVSKGSANRILRRLAGLGFLEGKRKGRMVFYKLQFENNVVKQFKILSTVYQLQELVDSMKEYCRRVILFGSCSEGTDVKDSDIDLFILTDQKKAVNKAIAKHEDAFGKKIAPIILNANESVKLRASDKPLYERIMKGVTLWQAE